MSSPVRTEVVLATDPGTADPLPGLGAAAPRQVTTGLRALPPSDRRARGAA